MYKAYRTDVKIGKEIRDLLVVNYTGKPEELTTTVDRIHHIHILDFSYSMSSYLRALGENVRQTIDLMSDNDLVSILWFSGEGENGIIGVPAMTKSDYIKNLADKFAPVGLTCFSEVLEGEASKIIDQFASVCPNFNVTFFTDGETVTHHSRAEEEDRIFAALNAMQDKIMAFNTIGYGWYYNENLLKKMAETTAFGRMIHSSKISEYTDIFARTRSVLNEMVVQRISVEADGAEILYLGSKITKLGKNKLDLNFADKKKNQFFILIDSEFVNENTMQHTIPVTINGETINVDGKLKKPSIATINNFLYAYASELFYKGDSELALDVLAESVLDKNAVDGLLNAFTADERQAFHNKLTKMVFINRFRNSGSAPANYIPADDAFCVMDLLNLLSIGQNFYVPVKEYNRIGLKVTDEFNLFKASDAFVMAPFNEFVFNADHLNLSIRYMVGGTVSLNPKQADAVGLPKTIFSRIFRMQTLIKDGNINVPKFSAFVDGATYAKLIDIASEVGPFFSLLRYNPSDFSFNGVTYYIEIDLTKLPVINRMYARKSDSLDTILEVVKNIENLKAKQKVVKYYIDKNPATYAAITSPIPTVKADLLENLTDDQISVLKDHGLNAKLDYVGVDNNMAEKNEKDTYLSRLLSFELKGWSSLPKVDDVIEKLRKRAAAETDVERDKVKLNGPATAMAEALELLENSELIHVSPANKAILEDILAATKREIMSYTVQLNTLKIAKVLTGGWWKGLEVDAKDSRKCTYTSGDDTLVIKNDRVVKHFSA